MIGVSDPMKEQASREAADWFILLEDDPDNAELKREFGLWLDLSPINADAWEAVRYALNAVEKTSPVYADRWERPLSQLRARPRDTTATEGMRSRVKSGRLRAPAHRGSVGAHGRRRRAVWIGSAAAACLLALIFGPGLLVTLQADHATGTAEVKTVALNDGSIVTLAPDSAIDIAYSGEQRRIRLLSGEAFFEVAPDAERPFQAAARGIDVEVLGTRFNVRRSTRGANIAVEHGVVRVGHDADTTPVAAALTAGQTVQVTWQGQAKHGDRPLDQIAAWRHNQLIARDEPLGMVVDQIRRYHSGRIIIASNTLSTRPVTGVYNLADPLAALRGIARAQNAVVRRITPWLVVVSSF